MIRLISYIIGLSLSFNSEAVLHSKQYNQSIAQEAIRENLDAVPGQYIIKLKGSSLMPQSFGLSLLMNSRPIKVNHGNYQLISFFAQLTNTTLNSIKNHPNVEYIEPNYIYYIQPDKRESFSNTGNVNTTKTPSPIKDTLYKKQWGHPRVKVDQVWSTHKGSKDIIVAVIDTGIYYEHEDLKENIWVNQLEKDGISGVDDDGNGFIDDFHGWDFGYGDNDPRDGNGHGTHCAGTIGAVHNDKGIRGINKNIRLMALQFGFSTGGATVDKAIQAINYAVANGANILTNSWGGFGNSIALRESIEAAREKGILFVAASGNDKRNIDIKKFYPASYDLDNIFVVSSIDPDGKKSSFASWGKKTVDLFAPGRNILSTVNKTNWRPKWYRKTSGTSMATPYVAGAAALLLSANPNFNYLDISSALMRSAAPSVKTRGLAKGGLLDIKALLSN